MVYMEQYHLRIMRDHIGKRNTSVVVARAARRSRGNWQCVIKIPQCFDKHVFLLLYSMTVRTFGSISNMFRQELAEDCWESYQRCSLSSYCNVVRADTQFSACGRHVISLIKICIQLKFHSMSSFLSFLRIHILGLWVYVSRSVACIYNYIYIYLGCEHYLTKSCM